MNKNKIKLVLHSAEGNVCRIVDKLLEAEIFNFLDFCWWWNPDINWWSNKKYAKIALKILVKEKCCVKIRKSRGICFRKTKLFVDLLYEILRIEEVISNSE